MGAILKIDKLCKNYGKLVAVDNLSLEVNEGNVFGILGPNGSGKTTTLGMILDVISITSGEYQWFHKKPTKESRKKIGAILEMPAFYPYLSAIQNLKIVAKIKGKGVSNIENVLQQVGLYNRRNDPFKNYSLGMKQRLSIGSALLTDPPVLILDEPTNGLDPQGIAEIREIIKKVALNGKTILFASHLLDEVQKVCSHFAVLNYGKKIYEGTVEEAMAQNQTIELGAKDMDLLRIATTEFKGIDAIENSDTKLFVKLKRNFSCEDLNNHFFSKGIVLTHLAEKKSSLEQKFLKILAETNE